MSQIEVENIENETLQKKSRGRPKTGFNRVEYNKEYMKEYNKKVNTEKNDAYKENKLRIKEYNDRCRKAYQIMREINKDPENGLKAEYIKMINTIFSIDTVQTE